MRPSYGSLLILCLCVGGASLPLRAAPAQAAIAYGSLSMDQAVKLVEQRYRARVVKAEAQHDGAHTVYVLRLLNDSGRVWTVHVDAASGSIT
jgi:uncharacterized membrane protein YkoI